MFGLQGDPISNRKVQLDGVLICSLIGCYLRGDPANSAYVMPAFRVEQLVERIRCHHGDNGMFHGSIDPNVLEVVGCLYTLCMYLAVTPNLDSETAFRCARCIHMVLGESLQVMNDDKKQRLELLHPYVLFNKDNAYGIHEGFKQSLHSAKEIMRDVTKVIRICREPKTHVDTKFDKLDCWQAHSIYFMCAFGLCHFSGVLKSTNNLNVIPGQIESLILIASLVPKPHHDASETVKLFKEENTRFYLLMEQCLNMGRVMVHFCIDDRTIQELHIHKQHYMKMVSDPACDYSRLKGMAIKAFLGTPSQNLFEDEKDLNSRRQEFSDYLSIGSENDIPTWYRDRPVGQESSLEQKVTEFAASGNEDLSGMYGSASKPGTRGSAVTDARGDTRGQTRGTDKPGTRGGLTTAGSTDGLRTKPSTAKILPRNLKSAAATAEEHSDDVKESAGCWRLRKYYRPAFMTTRFLRKRNRTNKHLSENYTPKKMFTKKPYDFYSAKGLSLTSLSKAVRIIDSIVYYSDEMEMCPRYLNPDKGLSWMVIYIIDYIYQATFYGGGFSTDEQSKAKKLRTEVKMAKTERLKHLKASTPSKSKLPSFSPTRSNGNGAKKTTPGDKSGGLDLMQRLSLVAKEAQAEAELDTIAGINREKKRVEKLRAPTRMRNVDRVLREGTGVMRNVTKEQSTLFADLYGEENMYSDTDDDDDYTDTDEDEEEEEEEVDGDGEESDAGSTPASSRKVSEAFDPFNTTNDPFRVLELMQQNNLNDKGQAMGVARNEDPLQSYLAEPGLHQINKFRKKLKKSGIVKAGKRNLIEAGNRVSSVVWTFRQAKQNDSTQRRINAGKLSSNEQAQLYIEEIKNFQKERNDERFAHLQELEDVQDMEISKTRAHRLGVVHEAREERRIRQLESAAIVAKKAEDKARAERLERQTQRMEEKLHDERNRKELSRITDIAAHKKDKTQQQQMESDGRAAVELIRLREMEEAKEYREIIRRYREEFRMKQLEERRRYLENKEVVDAAVEYEKLQKKRFAFKMEKKLMARRVRGGSFMPNGEAGKMGFYDDVRAQPVDWVQYHDENGVAYYYDPVLNVQTYDVPNDADFHHHSVDDRRDYDAVHGEGAYDEEFWNAQMMESVNNEGGFYDKEGQWQDVNGMYSEDGTFFNFDEGYIDESGNYVLFPNVVGTLDFMV